MAVTKNKFSLELHVSELLTEALQPQALQKMIDNVMKATGKFIFGGIVGQSKPQSVIGRHFNRNNIKNYNYAPLNPKYAAWKKKHFGNKPILVREGKMKQRALVCKVYKTSKNAWIVKPRKPTFYHKYHEEGGKNLPARPSFTMNKEDEKRVKKYFAKTVKSTFGELAETAVMTQRV